MRVVEHPTGAAVLARAGGLLEASEAENGLVLGILCARTPARALLATIEHEETGLVAVAVRTPPFNLVISRAPEAALEALVEWLVARGAEVPGVNAEESTAQAFAALWSRARGCATRVHARMRVYAITDVVPPPRPPPGFFRAARPEDEALLVPWGGAFARDAGMMPHEVGVFERQVKAQTAAGALFLWDDGGPASMAACTGATPHGVRINMVYTPEERRRRGYASACVAALSRRLLDGGRTFCSLNADLANPTSNAIYQAIGYREVCDFWSIQFD